MCIIIALEFKANLPEVMVVTRKKHKKDYEQANSLMSIQGIVAVFK